MNMTADHSINDILARIGKNARARELMIAALRDIEEALAKPDLQVREEITGPLVDALHRDHDDLTIGLEQGVTFRFLYRSKIAREIVMNPDPRPDFVWEPQTTRLLLHFGRGARHIAIGGAYGGDHAILLAHQISNSGGTVHCFEPNAEQLGMLRANAEANGLTNLVLNRIGLWSTGRVKLVLVGDDSHAHPEPASGDSAAGADAFETIALDAYGAEHGIESLDLLMLDIEGAEYEALRGAERYLSMPPGRAPRVVFEIHGAYVDWSRGLQDTAPVRFLAEHGYFTFAIRDVQGATPFRGCPVELIPADSVYLGGPPHGFNMLAVKNPADVEDKSFRLVRGVSPKYLGHRDPALYAPLGP